MEPGLPTFSKILVFRATPPYSRWSAIAFRHPLRLQEIQVKRIVGLPGERIRVLDGNLYREEEGKWLILKKPRWLQEKGQRFIGQPLFEEIRHHRQTLSQNTIQWIAENRWHGWDLSRWKQLTLPSEEIAYQGEGKITYTLPDWAIFERPGGVRSDQAEKIKVLEIPNAEVRFRLVLETQPPFSGRIQEAQHEIVFHVQEGTLHLAMRTLRNDLQLAPLLKQTSIQLKTPILLEFGNYDDFAFVEINGTRLELDYPSDPFQEKMFAQFEFEFGASCVLREPFVAMDNAYKEEIEGTLEAHLKKDSPAEYFVCGDNTLTGRIVPMNTATQAPPLDLGLSNDSRTWEKVVVTQNTGKVDTYEDRMEEMGLYEPHQPRFGAQVDFGVCDPGLPEDAILGRVIWIFPESFSQIHVFFMIVLLFVGLDFFCFYLWRKCVCRPLKVSKND